MMHSIERYIVGEITRPLLAVIAILTGLFAAFSGARYLAEALTESMGLAAMLELIFLKTFIALEVLVPIALYVATIIGVGRLHRDQEIIAMRAAGVGTERIVKAVLVVALPVGILVAILSGFGRPWAYQTSYVLDALANAELNTDRLQPGRFYGNEDSGRIIYIGDKDPASNRMHKVLHYLARARHSEVILAADGYREQYTPDQRPQLHLLDGYIYRLQHAGESDVVTQFKKLVYFVEGETEIGYKRKAASTPALSQSEYPRDIAELQWRLSRPLATVLLALLAIPLSRSLPRQGRKEKYITAALVFAAYYNLNGLAQSWVEQGVIGEFPGVWWLHACMFFVVIAFLRLEMRPGFQRH